MVQHNQPNVSVEPCISRTNELVVDYKASNMDTKTFYILKYGFAKHMFDRSY